MGVLLWTALSLAAVLVLGTAVARLQRRRFRAGAHVIGHVIDREKRTGDMGDESFRVRFGYAVDGDYFHVTQSVRRHLYDSCQVGTAVGVRYLPGRPSRARLETTIW